MYWRAIVLERRLARCRQNQQSDRRALSRSGSHTQHRGNGGGQSRDQTAADSAFDKGSLRGEGRHNKAADSFSFAAAMFPVPVHASSTRYGKPDGLKLVCSATWQFNGKCDDNEMVFAWQSVTGRTNAPPGDPFIRPFENFLIIVIGTELVRVDYNDDAAMAGSRGSC
jgi:hypothetical protein